MLRYFAILFIVATGGTAYAGSVPYKGAGGQIEAYGAILGTYYSALAFVEICSEDSAYKIESEKTARNYLNSNKPVLDNVWTKLRILAVENGGEKEKARLIAEIAKALPSIVGEVKSEARKQVVSKKSCASILANLRSGVMDLKTQRSNEIALILK